jgi:hypothetical protein
LQATALPIPERATEAVEVSSRSGRSPAAFGFQFLEFCDYRLVARVQDQAGVLVIRFFGTHAEYDKIDSEIV